MKKQTPRPRAAGRSRPADDLPDVVKARLRDLALDLRFWVERERESPTPAQTRNALAAIEEQALRLRLTLEDLDPTPRAHLVAKLQVGLRDMTGSLYVLHAAARAASAAIPAHKGNVPVGVPRYAAERIVAIFIDHGLPVTLNATQETPVMRALADAMESARYPLGASSIRKYLRLALRQVNQSRRKRRIK